VIDGARPQATHVTPCLNLMNRACASRDASRAEAHCPTPGVARPKGHVMSTSIFRRPARVSKLRLILSSQVQGSVYQLVNKCSMLACVQSEPRVLGASRDLPRREDQAFQRRTLRRASLQCHPIVGIVRPGTILRNKRVRASSNRASAPSDWWRIAWVLLEGGAISAASTAFFRRASTCDYAVRCLGQIRCLLLSNLSLSGAKRPR
jgi:hypothetical protein